MVPGALKQDTNRIKASAYKVETCSAHSTLLRTRHGTWIPCCDRGKGIVLAQHWSRPMVQQLEHLNKEQSHVLVPEKMGLPWLLQKMLVDHLWDSQDGEYY